MVLYSRYLARSFTFILPYFPTGTMERVDKEGQIATAKVFHSELIPYFHQKSLTARGRRVGQHRSKSLYFVIFFSKKNLLVTKYFF